MFLPIIVFDIDPLSIVDPQPISELSSIPGELSSYLDSPPTGYIYNYYIISVDNEMPPNESNPTA